MKGKKEYGVYIYIICYCLKDTEYPYNLYGHTAMVAAESEEEADQILKEGVKETIAGRDLAYSPSYCKKETFLKSSKRGILEIKLQ